MHYLVISAYAGRLPYQIAQTLCDDSRLTFMVAENLLSFRVLHAYSYHMPIKTTSRTCLFCGCTEDIPRLSNLVALRIPVKAAPPAAI